MSDETIDVAAAMILRDGRVLIAKRARGDTCGGKWEFPGGQVEPGETPQECLRREIHEELGVRIRPEGRPYRFDHEEGGKRYRFWAYPCSLEAGEPQAKEHEELRWVQIGECGGYDLAEADRRMAEWVRGHWDMDRQG